MPPASRGRLTALVSLLACLLLATVAPSAVAAVQTVEDDDDQTTQDYDFASFDVRKASLDPDSSPGNVVLRLELDYRPDVRIDGAWLFDTDNDGLSDFGLDLTGTARDDRLSRHPALGIGSTSTIHYKLRAADNSTNECQHVYDRLPQEYEFYDTATASVQTIDGSSRTVFAITIPLSAFGNPSGLRWGIAGESSRNSGATVTFDYATDATNGGFNEFSGEAADPKQEYFVEGGRGFFRCSDGFSDGWRMRLAQGERLQLRPENPPTVSIDQSPAQGRPGDTLTFIANATPDGGATISSYAWDLDRDGQFDDATGRTASRRFDQGGRRFVAVRVTDSNTLSTVAERTVDILDRAPVVSGIDQSPQLARPNRPVTLTANATDDGQITSYSWDTNADGVYGDAFGRSVTATFPQERTYAVGVKVGDDAGNFTDATRAVEVAERAPTMSIATSKERPIAKEKFTLTASVGDDAPVDESKIQWGFDLNGNDSDPYNVTTGRDWTLSFGWPGTYTMKARYTDDSGKTVRATRAIEIPNTTPVFREIRVRKKFTPDQPGNNAPLVRNETLFLETLLFDDNRTRPKVEWDLDEDGDFDDAVGERVERAFSTSGEKRAKVRITDEQGAVAFGEGGFEVRDTADGECAGQVNVDGMRAVGCFRTQPDGTKTTKEPISVNGVVVEPTSTATTIKVNPSSGLIDTGDGFVRIRAGDVVLYEGRWKMDPNCDRYTTECLAFRTSAPAISKLKGLPLKGDIDVYFTPKGTRIKVNVDVFGSAGVGATARADFTVNDKKELALDDLEIRVPALPGPKNFTFGPFFLKYEKAFKRWSGGGVLTIPTPQFTKLDADFAFREDTGFERIRADVDGLNIPIDPFGTFYFQRIAFTMEIKGIGTNEFRIRLGGGLGASLGPRVGGIDGMTLDGDFLFTFGWPLGIDIEGRMSVFGYDIIGASIGARTNGTVDFNGQVGIGLPLPAAQKGLRPKKGTNYSVSKFNPNAEIFNPFQIITAKGSIRGWVEPTNFAVEGEIAGKVIGITLVGAKGLFSSKGVAGCGKLLGLQGGFGYEWVSERTDLFGDSCDLSPWEPERQLAPLDSNGAGRSPTARAASRATARQAAGGGSDATEIDLPAGQKVLMLRLKGAGGDPVIRLVSPSGKAYVVPAGDEPVQSDDFIAAKNPQEGADETYVGVRQPAAGRWRIERQPGSVAISDLSRSEALPEPQVSASVSGSGPVRTLTYAIKPIPGQTVDFVEYGDDVKRTLGTAKDARGAVRFRPRPGKDLTRRIVAIVKQGGLPRRTFRLGRFTASKPKPPAQVRQLRVRRLKGGRLRVAWAKVPGALRYQVLVRYADGRSAYRDTTCRTWTFRRAPRGEAAIVDVRAFNDVMLRSKVARARLSAKRTSAPRGAKPLNPVAPRCGR